MASGKKRQVPSKADASRGGSVTRAQIAERIRTAEQLKLRGTPRRDAVDALRAKYGISTRRADELLAHVTKKWGRESEADGTAQRAKAEAIRRLGRDAFLARQAGDTKAAVAAERLLAQIEGTLAPTNVRVVDVPYKPEDFNEEGRRRVMDGEDPDTVLKTGGAARDPAGGETR